MARDSLGSLPPERRRLLRLMQQMNFGRFEELVIRDGQPVLEPPPRQVHEFKFPGDNSPRPELSADDFLLKTQVVELFQHFDQLGDGTIEVLEIKHGLPFRMLVAEAAA